MRSRLQYALVSLVALTGLAVTGSGQPARAANRSAASGTLTVFAAASLNGAFTAIGNAFGKANNATVKLNFNASDQLETQLAQGAPADVFASADQAHMTLAQSHGLIAGTPAVFTHNKLVVIVPRNNPAHIENLADLANPGVSLVLAGPTVPVGKYARAAFTIMASDEAFGPNFLANVQKNIKSNEINDTAVVTKVALGEADAGVVYVSDLSSKAASQLSSIDIPAPFNQLATYPIAVTKTSQNAVLARKFVSYVLSSAGQSQLKAAGFLVGGPSGGYASSFTVGGLVQTPRTFTVADLRTLPATTVRVTLRTDKGSQGVASYTGPLLYTVIQQAAPIANTSFTNDFLRQFVTVGATDGYQVTVSLAEIAPQFGNQKVILAFERNGRPLSQSEGAVRLIVPGDYLAGRWVTNVNSIVVGTPVGTP